MLKPCASIFPVLLLAGPLAGAQGSAEPYAVSAEEQAVLSLTARPDRSSVPNEGSAALPDHRSGGSTQPAREFRRVLYAGVFTGANWPVGDTNVVLDPSFLFLGRAEYGLSPTIRAGFQLSFHSFDAERPGTRDNEGVINLSFFGKALGFYGPYRPFALLGAGAYISKEEDSNRRLDLGGQVGVGLELAATKHLSVATGTGLHVVFRGGGQQDLLWLDGYLGFLFREP